MRERMSGTGTQERSRVDRLEPEEERARSSEHKRRTSRLVECGEVSCSHTCACRSGSKRDRERDKHMTVRRSSTFPIRSCFLLYFALTVSVILLVLFPHPSSCASSSPSSSESSSVSVEGGKVVSQSEVKTIQPTNNPTKVFVRRRIFRKLVKDHQQNGSVEEPSPTDSQSTTPRPRTLYSLVKRLNDGGSGEDSPSSPAVTGSTLKMSMSNSQSLVSKQKFNFQSLKTRLGLAAGGSVVSTTTTQETTTTPSSPSQSSENPGSNKPDNSSLVMIPLPPNQRKPYTPVIMQVSKSTTAKPETTVHTYKLNKMFVPIGIYGKVLENGNGTEGADNQGSAENQKPSNTVSTSVRHKGTDDSSEKKNSRSARRHKGIAESVQLTYEKSDPATVSLTTERPDVSGISITTEVNELFGSVFGSSNNVRRGDHGNQFRNKNKPFSSSSGLTLMTPPALGGNGDSSDSQSDYSSYSTYSGSSNHFGGGSSLYNHKNKFHPSAIVGSITDSMSRIPSLVPSLFHKGLTSLASMTSSLKENPFVDDNFQEAMVGMNKNKPATLVSAPSSYVPKIPASVPGGYIHGMRGNGGVKNTDQAYAASEIGGSGSGSGKNKNPGSGTDIDLSEYETLEYFRKRPHLLAQLQQKASSAWRRSQGVRFSKGFKPANAPEAIAREYYKSTSTTTASTPENYFNQHHAPPGHRGKKMMRGSWLLRNSDEYVSNKNERLVNMWRNLFDSFSAKGDAENERGHQDRSDDKSPPLSTSSLANRKSDTGAPTAPASDSSATTAGNPKSPTPSILNQEWSLIKRKYSPDQINEAKERILTLLNSGYGDEALLEGSDPHHGDELAHEDVLQHSLDYDTHMPPPPPSHHHHHHHSHSFGHGHGHGHHHHHNHPHHSPIQGLTKGLSGAAAGAFKDLVKFFKLGVSVGAGHSKEPMSYEQVVDEQENEEDGQTGGAGDWKPVVRRPLISFSAGISVKNPLVKQHHHHGGPPPHHHHHVKHIHVEDHDHGHGHHHEDVDDPLMPLHSSTHYSSSAKPYIPSGYKGLSHYMDEFATAHSSSSGVTEPTPVALHPTPVSYAPYEEIGYGGHSPDDYDVGQESEVYGSYASAPGSGKSRIRYGDLSQEQEQQLRYTTLKSKKPRPGKSPQQQQQKIRDSDSATSDWSPVSADLGHHSVMSSSRLPNSRLQSYMSEYELVPSSVYLNGNGQSDPREIAAIVKPAGVSDDLVRSALPAGLRNLRILDYPYGGGANLASLNSVSQQVLGGGGGSKVSGGSGSSASNLSFKQAMKKLRENYVQKEAAYLPVVGAGGIDAQSDYLSGYYGTGASYYDQQPASLLHHQSLLGIAGGDTGSQNIFATANRINALRGGAASGLSHATQMYAHQQGASKDPLGFTSNYNLPQNLDPDIAAILKSELDKDDIPEDVRKEFLEAKQQEQQQQQQSSLRQKQQSAAAAQIYAQQQAQQQQQQLQQQQQQAATRRVDIAHQTLIDSLLSSAATTTGRSSSISNPRAPISSMTRNTFSNNNFQNEGQRLSHNQIQSPEYFSRPQPTLPTYSSEPVPQRPAAEPRSFFSQNTLPAPPIVTTRFFAPIPITPTLVTQALKNPRYSSPVPRYVLELARKLNTDKSVQGIVRVSAKRGRGLPPIEYLYPVKG